MGAGASAQAGIFGTPDGTVDPEAEWRSENTRELDRLGGNQRPALRRGQSTKYRLEWLKEALHEQGDRLEEALAKDPLAGRHEIMRQEALKIARTLGPGHHRVTVREWQTMKHTDLRSQQAREELERKLRDREKNQDRPAWNSMHWAAANAQEGTRRLPPAMLASAPAALSSATNAPSAFTATLVVALPPASTSTAPTSPPSASDSPVAEATAPEPPEDAEAETEETPDEKAGPQKSGFRALAPIRPPEPPAEWRLRIVRAKRKAMMIIRVVLAFRGRKYRARGLQRLDSLSYFVAQHLGPDLARFVEEQASYRVTRTAAADLQALAEEVWRDQNYGDADDSYEPADFPGLFPNSGPLPTSPAFNLGTPISHPATPTSPGGGGSNIFKPPPPPTLRLPGTFSTGGVSAAAGSGTGRSGSPLLRSRPINLTPTLHHISQAGNGAAANGTPSSSSGALPSTSGPLPQPLQLPTNTSAPATRPHTSNSHPQVPLSPSGALPILRRHNSGRMSMPSGMAMSQVLELEAAAAGGVMHPSFGGVGSSSKNARFSAPGSEQLIVGSVGTGSSVMGSMDDGSIVSMISIRDVVPAAPGLSGTSSKRWSSPRFNRRADKAEVQGHGQGHSQGHGTSSGSAGGWRAPTSTNMCLEDMSLVARAQSWAGPSALQPLALAGSGGGGGAGPHARSLGNDVPLSPSGAGPSPPGSGGAVLPAPPPMPSPATRNPRTRRESGLILTASTSTTSLPQAASTGGHQHLMRSPTSTADGYIANTGARVRHGSSGSGHGFVARSGSAVTSSSIGSMSIVRRPGRVGGSVTGEPGYSVITSSSYGERPGSMVSERGMYTSSTVRKRDAGSDQLFLRYQEEAAALEKPQRMMQLYANRANARWVEEIAGAPPSITTSTSGSSLSGMLAASGGPAAAGGVPGSGAAGTSGAGWEPPYVYNAARFSAAVGGAQAAVFKSEVATMLRAGKMAVQVLAGDDHIILGNGQPQPLWSADPWDLIATSFPAKAAAADHVRQVQMGPRLLMALVMAVEAVAGAEAVARLVVVLHMNDSQQEEVIQDLRYRKFCGLRPENLILLVQQRRVGYVWDPEHTVFVRDETSQPASAGSGYAIMQLVWPEEAFQITPDPSPDGKASQKDPMAPWRKLPPEATPPKLVPLGTSVLDHLSSRGVEWMLTRRLRDISLYHPDMTLDADVLAYTLFLHELIGANMAVQVDMVDSVSAARTAQGGIVLAPPRVKKASPPSPTPQGRGGPMRRAAAFSQSSGPVRAVSDVAGSSQSEGGSGGTGGGVHPHVVVDIKNSDTATPRIIQLLNELRARAKGRLAVSTRRYMWRVDVLHSLVQRSSLFHPSLEVAGDLAYLTFDMSDITAATDCGARCVAVSSRHPARSLSSGADIDELLVAILAQDAAAPFRRMAGNVSSLYTPAGQERPSTSQSVSGGAAASAQFPSPIADIRNQPPGQRIVVFVADNESTSMAIQLLMSMVKPGRDTVQLVTVVSSVLQEPAGKILLRRHESTLAKTMVEVTTELLTKNASGSLVDQLELFCEEADAQLIVMGSQLLAVATVTPPAAASSGGSQGGNAFSIAGGGTVFGSGMSFSGGGAGVSILGSVAASFLKNATRPMLIVKANAKHAAISLDKDKLRVLVEVHHNSRSLLRYVCSKLVSPLRYDKVYLTKGGAKDASSQDINTSRRLLENFSDIATQYHVPVVKRSLEEPIETGAVKYADHDKIHIIAVQAPAGRGVPHSIFNVVKAARSAVLIYKSNDTT